jgi:hypothetical protein
VSYTGQIAGERLGQSLDARDDYNGDGVVDFVAGAPNSPGANNTQPGRAIVLSGYEIKVAQPTHEIYVLKPFASGVTPASIHFGAAVRACRDLNGDGLSDILVGAPDFFTTLPIGPGKGAVTLFSGASGERLSSVTGANNDRLGDALADALEDLDGDGFREFAVAGSLSDAGGTDSGVVKCYRLFPVAPTSYCTAKVNSLGCTPSISFSGSPSASAGAPFQITASSFVSQKTGLLFYSHAVASASFQGGFKCAANPTVRTPPQNSGGSTSGSDCSGTYAFDFNAWMQSGGDPSLAAGAQLFAQYWSRDPASPSHTGLSNGLRFVINP